MRTKSKIQFSPRWKVILPAVLVLSLFAHGFRHEAKLVLGSPMTSWSQDVSADCGVVLTGGPNRLKNGIDLLSRGAVKKLIISGVNPEVTLREIFPHWPFFGTLKEEDIILEKQSMTTYGNAHRTFLITQALNCRDLVVVTSRVHMYRAIKTFGTVFPPRFPLHPWPVMYNSSLEPEMTDWISETFKALAYRLVLLF